MEEGEGEGGKEKEVVSERKPRLIHRASSAFMVFCECCCAQTEMPCLADTLRPLLISFFSCLSSLFSPPSFFFFVCNDLLV